MNGAPDRTAAATRIVLIDDHTLFRESLRRLLEMDGAYRIVAEVSSVEEALHLFNSPILFDLALVDYDLRSSNYGQNGLSLLRTLRQQSPHVRALMITAGLPSPEYLEIIRQLRIGVFLKSEPAAELLLALRKTSRGELWVSSAAAVALASAVNDAGSASGNSRLSLTPREQEVLGMVVDGLSNKEIGAQLGTSETGVKSVLQRLFEKSGVRTRGQLVRFVFEREIDLPS